MFLNSGSFVFLMDIRKYLEISGKINGSTGLSKVDYGVGDLLYASYISDDEKIDFSDVFKMFGGIKEGQKLYESAENLRLVATDDNFRVSPTLRGKELVAKTIDDHVEFDEYVGFTSTLRSFSVKKNTDYSELLFLMYAGANGGFYNVMEVGSALGFVKKSGWASAYNSVKSLIDEGCMNKTGERSKSFYSLTNKGIELYEKVADLYLPKVENKLENVLC